MRLKEPKGETFSERFENYEHAISRWGVQLLALLLAVAVVSIEILHAVPFPGLDESDRERIYLSAAIFIALGMVRMVFVIAKRLDKLDTSTGRLALRVETSMGEMRNSFAGLLDDLAQQLRLPNCIDSLKEEASRLYPIDLLEMDWLGLDMDHAWKYIDDAILGNHLIRRVHVRMLMISPVWDYEPSWLPRETHEWREHSSKRLAAIREWIDDELPQIRATGRELTLEIKLYDQLPVVHGFCVKKPILSWYISFCRWKGAKFRVYDWGENKYWKIKGEPLTPASRDHVDIFTGQFEHLWRTLPLLSPERWSELQPKTKSLSKE